MPVVDITDETYVARPPVALVAEVADPASWVRWWPDLDLRPTRDRGVKGVQWSVRGALTGSMEIWLEPVGDGVVLHWFLRADPPATLTARGADRERERRVRDWKRHAFALKDRAEGVERVT